MENKGERKSRQSGPRGHGHKSYDHQTFRVLVGMQCANCFQSLRLPIQYNTRKEGSKEPRLKFGAFRVPTSGVYTRLQSSVTGVKVLVVPVECQLIRQVIWVATGAGIAGVT